MEMLDLLWDLELHQQSLKKLFGETLKLENNQIFTEVEKQLKEKEKSLIVLKERQKKSKERLKGIEVKIKNSKDKVKELENSLYSNMNLDFKQLEILENEKNKMLEFIDGEEEKLLESLMEAEDLDYELGDLEKLLNKSILLYQKQVKKLEDRKIELKSKLEEIKEEINELENLIDDNSLSRFYQIRRTKGKAIVKIKNNICTGCNLQISFIQLDKIKNSDNIILCDNCGRILYDKK